jgi:nucleotide-binding universal stress UspA family protein
MTLRHLAVHVDRDKHCPLRLDYAVQLANKTGASLEGVFANVPPSLPPAIEGGITAQIIEAQNAYNEQAQKEAQSAFGAATGGCKGETSWTALQGYRQDVMARRAMGADLAIVGQPDPDEAVATTDFDLPADVVMRSGRPLLVIPYAGSYGVDVKSAVIAWNGTREAARAVADAIPLMEGAKAHVLAVNPAENDPKAEDVCAFLGRHGIEADHDEIHTRDLGPGDMILSRMSDLGAGLCVMGAYGHSRFREMILGGVTHHLLAHMTAPVLMSH